MFFHKVAWSQSFVSYNATSSLVRFESKNMFFCFEKRSKNYEVVGLAPGMGSKPVVSFFKGELGRNLEPSRYKSRNKSRGRSIGFWDLNGSSFIFSLLFC
jgi:hypothetical protein